MVLVGTRGTVTVKHTRVPVLRHYGITHSFPERGLWEEEEQNPW